MRTIRIGRNALKSVAVGVPDAPSVPSSSQEVGDVAESVSDPVDVSEDAGDGVAEQPVEESVEQLVESVPDAPLEEDVDEKPVVRRGGRRKNQ